MTVERQHLPGNRLYLKGVCLVLLAGVFLSSAGIIVRNIEAADGWQILFYRSLAFFVTVFAFTLWHHRGGTFRAYLRIGWPALRRLSVVSRPLAEMMALGSTGIDCSPPACPPSPPREWITMTPLRGSALSSCALRQSLSAWKAGAV